MTKILDHSKLRIQAFCILQVDDHWQTKCQTKCQHSQPRNTVHLCWQVNFFNKKHGKLSWMIKGDKWHNDEHQGAFVFGTSHHLAFGSVLASSADLKKEFKPNKLFVVVLGKINHLQLVAQAALQLQSFSLSPSVRPCSSSNHFWELFQEAIESFTFKIIQNQWPSWPEQFRHSFGWSGKQEPRYYPLQATAGCHFCHTDSIQKSGAGGSAGCLLFCNFYLWLAYIYIMWKCFSIWFL